MTLSSHDPHRLSCDLGQHPAVRRALAATRFVSVEHHIVVDSTQDTARQLALHTGSSAVVVADRQRRGRGRRGRQWIDDRSTVEGSPTNLAVSVAIAVDSRASLVPLITGLALYDVLRHLGIDSAGLKWPNDVRIADDKVAGILVEHHPHDRLEATIGMLVIGSGINLDWREVEREGLDLTSLAEHLDQPLDRADLLAQYLVALDRRLADLATGDQVLDDYRRACVTLRRQVRVLLPGGAIVEGGATGIDEHGRLVVETAAGRTTIVTAGDVVHVR